MEWLQVPRIKLQQHPRQQLLPARCLRRLSRLYGNAQAVVIDATRASDAARFLEQILSRKRKLEWSLKEQGWFMASKSPRNGFQIR